MDLFVNKLSFISVFTSPSERFGLPRLLVRSLQFHFEKLSFAKTVNCLSHGLKLFLVVCPGGYFTKTRGQANKPQQAYWRNPRA